LQAGFIAEAGAVKQIDLGDDSTGQISTACLDVTRSRYS
jgi:hypothetical protein